MSFNQSHKLWFSMQLYKTRFFDIFLVAKSQGLRTGLGWVVGGGHSGGMGGHWGWGGGWGVGKAQKGAVGGQ